MLVRHRFCLLSVAACLNVCENFVTLLALKFGLKGFNISEIPFLCLIPSSQIVVKIKIKYFPCTIFIVEFHQVLLGQKRTPLKKYQQIRSIQHTEKDFVRGDKGR